MVNYTGWDYGSEADFTKRVAVHPKKWHDSLDEVIKQLDYIRWIYHV